MKDQNLSSRSAIQPLVDFVSQCQGLSFLESGLSELIICQRIDGRHLTVNVNNIEKILHRIDAQKKPFLQVNFLDGKKILLTDDLIGFKPAVDPNKCMENLPKVVTTPDIISFIEVLENSVHDTSVPAYEIEDARQYFESILMGAEAIGFNLICERLWITRLLNNKMTVAQA